MFWYIFLALEKNNVSEKSLLFIDMLTYVLILTPCGPDHSNYFPLAFKNDNVTLVFAKEILWEPFLLFRFDSKIHFCHPLPSHT